VTRATQLPKPPGACIFCNGRPLTKEHVLSDWIGALVRTAMVNYDSVETDIGAGGVNSTPSKRSGHPVSRRVRCVCQNCNNGWMSGIVDAAKPVLIPLIRGNPFRLAAAARSKLAAWIATSVIVSEFENREHVTIPRHHRDWLWTTHTAPPDWKIWLGDYKRGTWLPHWLHHRFSVTGPDERPPAKGEEGPLNTQTTTYVVGQLYVHVISSAVSGGALDWQFQGRDRAILRPIWPDSPYGFAWPPPTMNDRDADRIAGSMMELGLRVLGLPTTQQLLRTHSTHTRSEAET
jgi:hypothetical protein